MSISAGGYGEDEDEREDGDTGHEDCVAPDSLEEEGKEVAATNEDKTMEYGGLCGDLSAPYPDQEFQLGQEQRTM